MRNVLERLLNLLAFLLTAGRPVTAEEIRNTVAGYAQESDEAFRRMFERDKDLLRQMGIPLQTRPTDKWEVDHGYAIAPDEYRLPDPDLTDDERTALWLAAQVVRIGGQPSGPDALLKLGGHRTTTGVEPLAADLGTESERLAELYAAVVERRLVAFEYRGRRRSIEPHGLGFRRGHWYLVAKEGGDVRVYRTDRMREVDVGGGADAFTRDPRVEVRRELTTHPWETGVDEPMMATVRFDPDVAWWALRRLGPGPVDSVGNEDGSVDVRLEVNHVEAFIGWVLTFGPGAEVIGPEPLRRRLIARVEGVA